VLLLLLLVLPLVLLPVRPFKEEKDGILDCCCFSFNKAEADILGALRDEDDDVVVAVAVAVVVAAVVVGWLDFC
jgi:hypothetical protein